MKAGVLLLGVSCVLATQTTPTFSHDIAPIIFNHCSACHRPGESAPFSLLTYDDVKRHAKQIGAVTQSRFMPPWLPQAGYGDFADANRLTAAQIKLIADWTAAGAPEGNAAEAPRAPEFTEGWQLGPPDLIVEAPQAFTLPATGTDVYWNFVLSPKLAKTRFVRAMEIRPGEKKVVHHANVVVDKSHWGREQEKSPGAGFEGMELANRRSIFDPDDGHFLFWKPGGAPYVEPDGLAWRLDPGADLVLNAHLRPTGKPEQVRPSIGLYFTDKPQTKYPMLLQLEHDGALNIAAGVRDFAVSDDFRLPMDADVLAVYPHAHYLGKLLEGYATLPDGSKKWLVRIPDWDQNWQTVYRFREPVFLPKGTLISMRFHYDNSAANVRNPNQPPKRVVAGNHATDEMGHLWLQILPRGDGDRRLELDEAIMKHTLEKYPDDFRAHVILGALYLARLNAGAAVPMAEAAVRIDPKQAEARNLLGSALQTVGRVPEAIVQFRAALALQPDFTNARFNLATALQRSGKVDEAIAEYQKILAEFPNDQLTKDRLAQAERGRGKK
ncbi:MAG TPA: tetratricopeptide repeat protein [Bryobacteraceae bacterium]|jgi:tetratricopeptide (TPR) repeat protein